MKIGFLGWKIALPDRKLVTFATASSLLATASYTWQRAEFARHLFATANDCVTESSVCSPRRVRSPVTASNLVVLYLFMFYCCFIHFCFELALGAYLKALGDIVSSSDGLFVKNNMIYELIYECTHWWNIYVNAYVDELLHERLYWWTMIWNVYVEVIWWLYDIEIKW